MASTSPSRDRYDAVAIALHWAMALLILANIGLGWYAAGLGRSPRQLELFLWHKSLGITLLALLLVRLAWRLLRGAPELPASMPGWQARAARLSHGLLYLLMLTVPLLGWALNSAANVPLRWFGWLTLPPIAPADPGLRELLEEGHEWAAWTLAVLAAIHAAAAVKHALVDRDGVFGRMLPRFVSRKKS